MNRTPNGHDPDGWFRQTIKDLIRENRALRSDLAWEESHPNVSD